jgi:hypothetical protein
LPHKHPDTGVRDGIFEAAYGLCDGHFISGADRKSLEGLLSWFEGNLAIPKRFNRSRSKGYGRRNTAGISWLKPTVSEHLARMRALAAILEKNGYQISQISTTRPGYVIFEDDHQVIAEPFRGEHD